jgi:hypothetical protein
MKRDDFDSLEKYINAIKEEAKRLGYTSFEGLLTSDGNIIPKGKLAFDFSYDAICLLFDSLDEIKNIPGLYQIHTFDGIPLKVGIAKSLHRRLKQHLKSSQSRLKPTIDGKIEKPNHLESKQSILAKHLFFDKSLTQDYDLETEDGRSDFLKQETYLLITYTSDRDEARRIEKIAERSDIWRYKGRVKIIDDN